MTTVQAFQRRSIADRDGFWRGEAGRIDWHKPFSKVLDYSRPPFAKWFVGGETNLCHNAVDRHLAARGGQKALVWISTEVDQVRSFSYNELFREVNPPTAAAAWGRRSCTSLWWMNRSAWPSSRRRGC
jgi:propionyl-CoA synthetase